MFFPVWGFVVEGIRGAILCQECNGNQTPCTQMHTHTHTSFFLSFLSDTQAHKPPQSFPECLCFVEGFLCVCVCVGVCRCVKIMSYINWQQITTVPAVRQESSEWTHTHTHRKTWTHTEKHGHTHTLGMLPWQQRLSLGFASQHRRDVCLAMTEKQNRIVFHRNKKTYIKCMCFQFRNRESCMSKKEKKKKHDWNVFISLQTAGRVRSSTLYEFS